MIRSMAATIPKRIMDIRASRDIAPNANGVLKCDVELDDEKTQPVFRADEFPDDGSDHRERYRDLEPGEEVRERRRKPNLGVDLKLRCR